MSGGTNFDKPEKRPEIGEFLGFDHVIF